MLCLRTIALFALGLLSLVLALSSSSPAAQADPIETDHFPNSLATVEIDTPLGSETVTLSGPTTVEVDLGSLADTDADGREQIDTEIVQMELTGHSALLGPVTMKVRDPAKDPFHPSVGEIEEDNNLQWGRFDLLGHNPPLCVEHPSPPPNCVGTTADSFFDVYFEVQAAGMVLHNQDPKRMEETITHKPPAGGETYENPVWIRLFDEIGNPTDVWVGPVSHTPYPPVGGIAELPVGGADSPTRPADGSASSAPYPALAGGAAAALAAITAGAWYARRRWLR